MYKLTRFHGYEILPPEIYDIQGDNAISLLDERLLKTLDALKNHYGFTIVVNDWHDSGQFRYRGYRPIGCNVGTITGAHYKGQAIDFNAYRDGKLISAKDMRTYLIRDRLHFPYIRAMELVDGWNHIDVMSQKDSSARNGITDGKILLFHPTDYKQNKII